MNQYFLSFHDPETRVLNAMLLVEGLDGIAAVHEASSKGIIPNGNYIVICREVDPVLVLNLTFPLAPYLNKFLNQTEALKLSARIEEDFLS